MKRHPALQVILLLGLFCSLSAGLFDNLSMLLQHLSVSLTTLSKELPAPAKSDSFTIPQFDKKDIIAIGNPGDFSGIPVTQLKVFDQASSGGDASCGYQALKNVAILISGIIAGKSGNAISQQLHDKDLANRLFGTASARIDGGQEARNGIWRETIIIESALIPIFRKLYIEPVFSLATTLKPYDKIATLYDDANKRYIYNTLSTTITNYQENTIARNHIKNAYKQYLAFPQNPDTQFFEKTYRPADLKNEFILVDEIKPFLQDFSILIRADFEEPQKMGQKYATFREEKKTDLAKEAYKALPKTIQDEMVALIRNMYVQNRTKIPLTDESKVTEHPEFIYALSAKSPQEYNKINRETPQPIDVTGDWINDKNIEMLIPAARDEFSIPEQYPIFAIQSTQNVFDTDPLEELKQHILHNKSALNDLFGIVLGGQNIIDPDQNIGHWLGVVAVKANSQYQLFVVDSLNNANRINPDASNIATTVFNERIKKIAQAIASA